MLKNTYLRFPGGKSKVLTLSYDDGVDQDIHLAKILKYHGIKCTFNINSGKIAPEGMIYPDDKITGRVMTASQMLETYDNGCFEVACHSSEHLMCTASDIPNVYDEYLRDRLALEKMFNREIHGMAYPFGNTNEDIIEVCRSVGLNYGRTVSASFDFGIPENEHDWLCLPPTCHHVNARLDELCDKFLEAKPKRLPQMFYLWGHSYEFDLQNNWELIEKFAEKMSGKDDIWYATNGEIYDLWRDFTRLRTSVDGKICYNPTARDIWIYSMYSEKPVLIHAGETIRF